jgi:hypothetical protein
LKIVRIPSGQELVIKPEGQRSWNKETIYTDNSLKLDVDDIIYFESTETERFRITNKIDYSLYGYMEYSILSDFG